MEVSATVEKSKARAAAEEMVQFIQSEAGLEMAKAAGGNVTDEEGYLLGLKLKDGRMIKLTAEDVSMLLEFLADKAKPVGDAPAKRRSAAQEIIERSWYRLIYEELEGVDPELTRHDVFLMLSEIIPWSLVDDDNTEPSGAEYEEAFGDNLKARTKVNWEARRAAMVKYLDSQPQFNGFSDYFLENHHILLAPFTEPFGRVTEYQACLLLISRLKGHLYYLEDRMEGNVTGRVDDPHDWTVIEG